MERIPIRNTRSPKEVKPRVFDVLIEGNEVIFEVKSNKGYETIDLKDVLTQITAARTEWLPIST